MNIKTKYRIKKYYFYLVFAISLYFLVSEEDIIFSSFEALGLYEVY